MKPAANSSRFAANTPYTQYRMRRRRTQPAIQPNSGIAARVAKKVPVNSHCRLSTPPVMPIVSRTGRSMK